MRSRTQKSLRNRGCMGMSKYNAAADQHKAIEVAKYQSMSSKELASLSNETITRGEDRYTSNVIVTKKKIDAAKIKSLISKPIVDPNKVNEKETIILGPSSYDKKYAMMGQQWSHIPVVSF